MLAERIRQRREVTPVKHKIRYVKFSAEEMAYDVPKDVSHLQFRRAKPRVELDADVATKFKDAAAVNDALRKYLELKKVLNGKRKSA